jgi:hypothetical protein
MTLEQRRREIVRALEGKVSLIQLKSRIDQCRGVGGCSHCGDLCPVMAANWVEKVVPKVVALLAKTASGQLFHVRHTRELWARGDGELRSPGLTQGERRRRRAEGESVYADLTSVVKSLKRGLDKLNDPEVVAIGMVDAWRGYDKWELGSSLVLAGVDHSDVYDVFPGGGLFIEPVTDIRETLKALIARSRRPKLKPPFDASMLLSRRFKQEYYIWLAGLESNQRLFRYGCDRHFNRLSKVKRQEQPRVRKPHPYPYWLTPYMFNNHSHNCQCRACGGLGKYYRSG